MNPLKPQFGAAVVTNYTVDVPKQVEVFKVELSGDDLETAKREPHLRHAITTKGQDTFEVAYQGTDGRSSARLAEVIRDDAGNIQELKGLLFGESVFKALFAKAVPSPELGDKAPTVTGRLQQILEGIKA